MASSRATRRKPTEIQAAWLRRGLDQPGGKLPLFDMQGQRVSARIVKACLDAGWAEPWFNNPLKPDWHVCRLTEAGRIVAENATNVVRVDFSRPVPAEA